MNRYSSPEALNELRIFHASIGQRWKEKGSDFNERKLVAILLRCLVGQATAPLTGYEQQQWTGALACNEPEFASEMGWTLSRDVPGLLRPHFGPSFDFEAFASFYAHEVPGYTVVDIDKPFVRNANDRDEPLRKTWAEHVVRYLHHVHLFYRETADA